MNRTRALVFLLALAALLAFLLRQGSFSQVPSDPPPAPSDVAAAKAAPQPGTLEGLERDPAAVVAEGAAPPALRVEVRAAQDAAPLAGAEVFLSDNRLGATDDAGNFSAPWPERSPGATLRVRLAGYLPWEAEAAPQAEPIRALLVRAGVLRGRLVSADGHADWTGMSVLAHPEDMPADRAVVAAALAAGDPAVQRAATDGSGWFEFTGLPADRTYALHAGGPGWISPKPLRNVAVDGLELQVTMRKLFGIYLRYRGPDGGPLRVAEGLDQFPGGGITVPESRTSEHVPSASPALLLLPFALPEAPFYSVWSRWMLYCLDREDQPPLDNLIAIPGYRPLRHELTLRRVLKELPTEEVRLEPILDAWGSVAVTLRGLPPLHPEEAPAGPSNSAPQIGLVFFPRQQPKAPYEELNLTPPRRFSAVVQDPRRGGVSLDGIPAGAYEAAWYHVLELTNLPSAWGPLPLQDLIVEADRTTELTFDLSATGGLRILAAEGLAPLRGPLQLELRADDFDRPLHRWWDAPYLLYGLTPGLIQVREARDRRDAMPVLVEAGRWTEVRLPPP